MYGFKEIQDLDIKTSKTGEKILVADGVHLHSAYDPVSESHTLLNKFKEALEVKNKVLILGLGLGYHVREIESSLTKKFGTDYLIYVFEPCEKVYNAYKKVHGTKNEHIKILTGVDLQRVYGDSDFIEFLLEKPVIVPHPASFNLQSKFYKNFLSFKSSQSVGQIKAFINNQELIDYLDKFGEDEEIRSCAKKLKVKKDNMGNILDFVILAYDEMTKSGELQQNKNLQTQGQLNEKNTDC